MKTVGTDSCHRGQVIVIILTSLAAAQILSSLNSL